MRGSGRSAAARTIRAVCSGVRCRRERGACAEVVCARYERRAAFDCCCAHALNAAARYREPLFFLCARKIGIECVKHVAAIYMPAFSIRGSISQVPLCACAIIEAQMPGMRIDALRFSRRCVPACRAPRYAICRNYVLILLCPPCRFRLRRRNFFRLIFLEPPKISPCLSCLPDTRAMPQMPDIFPIFFLLASSISRANMRAYALDMQRHCATYVAW